MEASVVDETLSEDILNLLKEVINSGVCQELTTIWTELWDENERIKRREILAAECQREIREFLQDVLLNEKKVRDDYIARVEKLLSEMSDLQKSLEITIPYEDVENLPLHIMAAKLNKKAEKYRVLKNERISKFNELIQKESELCDKLGAAKPLINTSEFPTKAQLKSIESHVAAMEQEKVNRTVAFLEQREAIIKLYEELGAKPLLTFEREIVSDGALDHFVLSNENMEMLGELHSKLESLLKDAKQKVNELLEKLTALWNYIGEPEEHQQQFLAKQPKNYGDFINCLKEELTRCETKKKENIATIVERMRRLLVEEWDKCLIGKEEREKFRPMNINCFTEDLCELHELEIQRLKNFYRDNEQIFVLIAKHEKLFNKLLELENGSKNANRYYNRGGQLLQEEKERKLITKELPLVEQELRTLLKKYEEDHGKPFTSLGAPMELILDEQWNAHFDQKAIEKLSRKQNDKKKRTPLGKRTCGTPYTPLSANKVPKLNNEKVVSSTSVTVTPQIPKRNITVRKKPTKGDNEPHSTFSEPTYDEFQTGIQSKVECSAKVRKPLPRSTAVNDVTSGILRERNTPTKIRPETPIKTTPGKLAPPMWSPSSVKTPCTVPRARRQNQAPRLTPARNRMHIII